MLKLQVLEDSSCEMVEVSGVRGFEKGGSLRVEKGLKG